MSIPAIGEFAHNALNRLTNMVDAVGTNRYTYTAAGQLLTEDGPWANDIVTNEYSNRLRTKLSLQQPTGIWTNGFAYDAAKRLTNVSFHGGKFGYTFLNSASHLTKKIALPNTAYITNKYDSMARLLETKLLTSTSSLLDSAAYGYNAGNQRTTTTNASGAVVDYTYDAIGQLKWANSATNSEDRGYAYDAAWNLTHRTNLFGADTFSLDGKNQLTNTTIYGSQAYDANGNRTNNDGGVLIYEYDDENQLTYFEGADYQTYFTYDGQGRLRTRQDYVYDYEFETWWLQHDLRYIYNGRRVIQEHYGAGNSPLVSYTRGSDLSGSMEGAGGIGGLLARSHSYSGGNFSQRNFYHADGNGNITAMISTNQTIVARYRYDAFGNTLSASGSLADANTYRFSSKDCHPNSGLYSYGYRWYDPLFQRWPNRDPLGEEGGWNLYEFVSGNPVSYFDAFGLQRGGGPSTVSVLPTPSVQG